MNRRSTPGNGFTLIELILVMAILAMVAAIAVPRLTGFSEGREYVAEWNRFTSLLRFARSQAISRYRIKDKDGQDKAARSPSEHVLAKKLSFEFPDFTDACRREDGCVSIRFLPDGSVDDQSPKRLLMVEENGSFVRELEQDPVRGYVAPKTPQQIHGTVRPSKN
jgi:prepilin-type N-terminal cleavage/methylation domain-containing protein